MSRPVALLVVLLVAVGSGCTTKAEIRTGELPDRPTATRSSPHNAADASYAQQLGFLHDQAFELAREAASREEVSPQLGDLADRVRETRVRGMVTLDVLRGTWGVDRLASDFDAVPGALTGRDVRQLRRLDGPAFERLWLERLTDNYEGSIALSQDLLDTGLSVEGQKYAQWLVVELQEDLEALERHAEH
ncbi:MAG TPA: DUF305 domain-containing protein [Nocardioidaceae bacterium]|nr:DUF305 domain-containing protein [Nocardioidaceae bacterium]